jgi:uncharacterized membrane protein
MDHNTITPLITNDAVVLGILLVILAIVFKTSSSSRPFLQKFYKYVPAILLCYFLPGILGTLGIISSENSKLYSVASRYLLPASLVLFTLSMDVPAILRLGKKAVLLFFAGTTGVVIGGPLAIVIVSLFDPTLVGGYGPDAVWRGMATVAGSWIGGSANQAALKELFGASDRMFGSWIAVDVIVANLWMACLLYGAGRAKEIDKRTGADSSMIESLQRKTAEFQEKMARIPTLTDIMLILGVAFGITAASQAGADVLAPWIEKSAPQLEKFSLTSSFFWLVVLATLGGIVASFTRLRNLEGAGSSRIGSALLYVLIATIGMNMNLKAIFQNPGFFLVGLIWMSIHAAIVLTVGKAVKAPFFFVAVGSQANIGGAASAPVVASAFHPALAPVGVLLAVLGYAVGTYAGWLSGILMQAVAPSN